MPLSSDSLFHYTRGGMDAVKGILSEGFRVSYSFEHIPPYTDYQPGYRETHYLKYQQNSPGAGYTIIRHIYIPMVCFCDIPISSIKSHLKNYGVTDSKGYQRGYAIGLTKQWGMSSGLNQALYVIPGSKISENLVKRSKPIVSFQESNTPSKTEIFAPPIKMELKNGMFNDNQGNLFPFEVLYSKPLGEIKLNSFNLPTKKNSFLDSSNKCNG